MSAPENLQSVSTNVPVLDGISFSRPWYFWIQSVIKAGNYALASLADLLGRDYAYGGSALTHVDRVTKVTAAGTIGEAAFADTAVVLGATNLTNVGKIPKVSSAATLNESGLTDDGTNILNTRTLTHCSFAGTSALELDDTTHTVQTYLSAQIGGGYVGTLSNHDFFVFLNSAAQQFEFLRTGYFNIVAAGLKIGGTQVVTTRQAALTATAAAGNAAGVGYLQADAATWVTLMNNLRTRVSELEARLQAHGLIT